MSHLVSLELLSQILDQSSDALIIVDEQGRIAYLNQKTVQLLGQDKETLINQFLQAACGFVLHTHTWQEWKNNLQLHGSHVYQVHAPTTQSTHTSLTVHGKSIQVPFDRESENKKSASYFSLTLTPLHISEQDRDLYKAIRALEKANQELEKASQAKDEFLASMSHELRTPLNSILGLSEALLESVYGKLNREQAQSISHIVKNGNHLLSLISDILDISKIRAGGMTLNISEVDVESICSEVIQILKPEMKRKRLSFSMSISGDVYTLQADERWFKQLVMNLISNAVKFTPSDKEIGLIVKGCTQEKKLRVTVWDHGIGIKEKDLGKLFKSFVQLDTSLARVYQGTGLGLAIASSIMNLHHGEVSVESEFGYGSSFHLDFPWDPQKGLEKQSLTPPPIELSSVLVVEDSKIDADKVKRYLDEIGVEVVWDPVGSDALNQAKAMKPDLILLDLYLPEESGWDILKKLKANPKTADIPVVVCSVLELDEQREEAILLHDYLVKPLSRRSLRRALRSYNTTKTQLEKALVVQPSEDKTELTILIVDDNQSNIQLVHDYLKRKGYRILTAEDGYQAVQVTRALQPDLILMDVQMPHMDGIEATSHIRRDPSVNHIPIFALTALAMPGDRERCLDAGMDQYFTKPVSLRKLYKEIKSTLDD